MPEIAITGGTGFLGRYLISHFSDAGWDCRCWHREGSDLSGIHGTQGRLTWIPGELGDQQAGEELLNGCDTLIHAALYRTSETFWGKETDLLTFVERNVLGSLRLFETAMRVGVKKIVYLSSCAVHDQILNDRPLDEMHPLWASNHYGAHKAAVEKFIHAYGYGEGYPICALRPTGIYGLAHPPEDSKWFDLVRAVMSEEEVHCKGGGKEVHAADVAKACHVLLDSSVIAGEAYSCYDQYISEFDVVSLTQELSGKSVRVVGQQTRPKNQIETGKIRSLGMEFGGDLLLRKTVQQMIDVISSQG